MSQGGLFGVGTSGLASYQRALQTTGHNIANAGTEGFSRQRVELSAGEPQQLGFGSLGRGVQTSEIVRSADAFAELRVGLAASAASQQRTLLEFSRQLDNLLADPEAGLAPALQDFFAAAADVANDPGSTAARQQLIARAQSLSDRFAQLERRIDDQRAIADGRIETTVEEINQLSRGIADLNREIAAAQSRSRAGQPNDLLDRRDRMVRELAERVGIRTVAQDDGAMNVFTSGGQPLVLGKDATTLLAQPMGIDRDRLDVAFSNGASVVVVTDQLDGGHLGALLALRDDLLNDASNALGRTALGLATAVNALHRRHLDLDGRLGEDFFRIPPPRVQADAGNATGGFPAMAVTDAAGLEVSDYELRFDGAAWQVRRRADGASVASAPPGAVLSFDGLRVDTAPLAGAAEGDRFLLQPLATAHRLETALDDPRRVAAALPVSVEPAPGNDGSLRVAAVTVLDPDDPDLRTPLTIEFDGAAFQVDGAMVPPDPSGETVIDVHGLRLVVTGTPQAGDELRIADNAGNTGDNRGALALRDLASERLLGGGTATVAESYGELVADVGVRTRRARTNADVQQRLLDDALAQREAVSGVNLDEEAANLVRYQQAYQASAQVIATASRLFETLLGVMQR